MNYQKSILPDGVPFCLTKTNGRYCTIEVVAKHLNGYYYRFIFWIEKGHNLNALRTQKYILGYSLLCLLLIPLSTIAFGKAAFYVIAVTYASCATIGVLIRVLARRTRRQWCKTISEIIALRPYCLNAGDIDTAIESLRSNTDLPIELLTQQVAEPDRKHVAQAGGNGEVD